MQLQLYVLPVSGRFQGELSLKPDEGLPSTLNCLLQASGLPHGQRLVVQVNDTLMCWHQGNSQTFSWELQASEEEIHIQLRNDAHDLSSWRGIWKGRAIYHLGALPIRVFFNGVEQPLLDASTIIPLVDPTQDPFPRNGQHTATRSFVEPASEMLQEETVIGEADRSPDLERYAFEEEVLTMERARAQEERRRAESAYPLQDDDMQSWDEEGEGIEENEEQQDLEEAEEEEQRDDSRVLPSVPLVLAEEQAHEAATPEEEPEVHDEDTSLAASSAENMPVSPSQPVEAPTPYADARDGFTTGKVAAFHADPTEASPACEHLKALLLLMPKKTVIIDLRELSRTRHKEESHPLSRAHLRADFGGRYWDRSQFLKTTYRSLPHPQQTMSQRWERVVSDVDHPEGLPFLEKYLRAGYSMIFLDATRSYEESTRRAVIIALRERIPQLEEVSSPA